ncbi:MAG: hypothetical protein VXX91_05280 [Planctomycetota bacterium]|nr:hypothetical protein [Planctomycetota bacterium]
MATYGFTLQTDSGRLLSWIVQAVNRRHAFDQLQSGDKPDQLLILTGRLTPEQENSWCNAALEHGGFDHQMAHAILEDPRPCI